MPIILAHKVKAKIAQLIFPLARFSIVNSPFKDKLDRVRAIKIDVEGAEWDVMQGLIPFIEKLREDTELIVEISHQRLLAQGIPPNSLIDILNSKGFNAYILENDYSINRYLFFKSLKRPTRFKGDWQITENTGVDLSYDFVFSRIDAEFL